MGIKELINFLNKLEESNIFYKLNKVRDEAIMVEITVPGQHCEVEFMNDGTVKIEKFISDGDFYDVKEIEILSNDFSDLFKRLLSCRVHSLNKIQYKETSMKEVIRVELCKLLGLKLQNAGRASNLFWMGFGDMIQINRRGRTQETPEYELHI
ncbi:hypothetical protein SAMN05444673_3094 [Bacillus sp. OV166]|uniref:hypothetical protein n=1 Tax=Bacillus sp. OV166 TaxID=1882763 RepID=UPI000A2ABCFB|nr:hypothetical protein [Bacillus sp. OV166]SMQ77832.1 hypothetical protein SAMN05444673_3094 [Bacillus sp. OV166]